MYAREGVDVYGRRAPIPVVPQPPVASPATKNNKPSRTFLRKKRNHNHRAGKKESKLSLSYHLIDLAKSSAILVNVMRKSVAKSKVPNFPED
jgi:hypothetical protein